MRKLTQAAIVSTAFLVVGSLPAQADMQESWTDGVNRAAIMEFVASVTTEGSASYVAPEDRIAVFDNDGTLWTEQPVATEIIFALSMVQAMAEDHPEFKAEEPFSIIVEEGVGALKKIGLRGAIAAVAAVYARLDDDALNASARAFLAKSHPIAGRSFAKATYAPVVDLVGYLHENDFEVFIVSGGSNNFMRVFSEDVYGIQPQNIIGSVLAAEVVEADGSVAVQRLPKIEYLNNEHTKVLTIARQIGQRPIIVVGNSDGDLAMMRYTLEGEGPRLAVLIGHDDDKREVAYEKGAENALAAAAPDGDNFLLVSMKSDFSYVWK